MTNFVRIISCVFLSAISLGSSLPNGVSVHRLDNGMDVILMENPALPMVGVNVVVKTGSAYETYATSGMSHMLEHLLFNGTTTRTQKELYDDTDRIGGYNNANTGEYYTNYMMVTPADYIRQGMEIQADMLFNSTLPEDKYEKEKGIVLEEIAQSLADPETQVEQDIQSILYHGHSLSLPTLGTYSTIESLPLSAVRQFYKGNYVPNNMILSAIGNFDPDTMLSWIKDIYGKPGPGTVFRPADADFATGFNVPEISSEGLFHRSHQDSTTLIHLAYPLPLRPAPGFFDMMDEILASKIDQIKSEARINFNESLSSISVEIFRSPVKNYLVIKATASTDEDLDGMIAFLDHAVKGMKFSMKKDAVTAFISEEKTAFYKSMEKPHMFGIYNASVFAGEGIDGFLTSFEPDRFTKAVVTLKRFKIRGNPLIIIHHPMGLENQETSDATLVKLYDHDGTGTTLIVKQNAASPLVAVHYLFKHKARLEKQFGKDAAKILHDCFGQRMKSDEIQQKIARYGLSFTVNDNPFIPMDNIYLHDDFGYIRVEGLADDLTSVITFLNTTFNDFVPTKKEYSKAVASFSENHGSMTRKNEARDTFSKLVEAQVYNRNQKEPPELTFESLQNFAKEYWTPQNLIISVVSPEEPETVRSLFTGFGGSTEKDTESAAQSTFRLNTEPVSILENGGGAQSYLFWGFIKEIDPEDKPALTALSLILADKIIFDIREKQGMAYRIQAGITVKKNRALFAIKFGTRPENVDVLLPQFPEFFTTEMLADVDQAMFEKSINMYLGRMMFRRLSGINQAYYLGYSQYFDGDMNADAEFLDGLKSVTIDDVKRVAEKYMDRKNPISVVVR